MNQTNQDINNQETQEWIESLRSILETSDIKRTHFILEKLIEFAKKSIKKIVAIK